MAKEKKPRKSNKLTAVPKPAKPKKVTLLDTELEPLKEAESILIDVEKAEAKAEEAALRVEIAKENYGTARLAYKDAVCQLRKLCRARKEKHPLFDKPAEATITKAVADSMAVTMPAVTITSGTEHGFTIGQDVKIVDVKPGGLMCSADGGVAVAVADGECTATEDVTAWIAEQRVTGKRQDIPQPPKTDWETLPLEAAKINGRGGKLLVEAGYETLGAVAKLMRDYGQWWNKEVKGIGEETAAEIADRFAAFWGEHPEYCDGAAA